MNHLNRIFAESRARAVADRQGIDDPETIQRIAISEAYRGYRQEIQPLIALKARFFMMSIPSIFVYHQDGRIESSYTIPPETQKGVDQIDELIEKVAGSWGFNESISQKGTK